MARSIRQNIFNTIFGAFKFALFVAVVVVQLPIILVVPRGRLSVGYMRIFMRIVIAIAGIRVRVHGQLSDRRPLMVVGNHISVFELVTIPVALGGSFFGKIDIASWPVIGWVSKKFGVIFVDRRPSHAMDALRVVQQEMARVSYPMFLFPEGTTNNGAYVKSFKSTLFNVVENSDITVQPMTIHYRRRDGSPISDTDMAAHYAYFDNVKQDQGPYAPVERNLVAQVFHIMVIGGFLVEVTLLPPPPLAGKNRKEMAEILHNIVSDNYMKLKDKRSVK